MCARSLTVNVRLSLIDRFNFNTLTNLRGLCLKFLFSFFFCAIRTLIFEYTYVPSFQQKDLKENITFRFQRTRGN